MTPAPNEDRLERLERQVVELADEVLKLVERSQAATSPDQAQAEAVEAWVWVDMAPDIAQERLEHLQAWMARVLVHHPRVVSVLHPCWYRHPAAVQMLLDVCRSWDHAYLRNPLAPHLSLTWWQRDLPCLERELARELGHCTGVRHDPDRIPLPLVDPAQANRHLPWHPPHHS